MGQLDSFFAALEGLQKTKANNIKLQQSKQTLSQEKDLFDIKKKTASLKLDEAEATSQISSIQRKVLDAQSKEYLKQQEDIFKGKGALIDVEDEKNRNAAKAGMDVINTTKRNVREGRLTPQFSGGKIVGFKEEETQGVFERTDGGINRIGTVEKGAKVFDKDKDAKAFTRKDAVDLAIKLRKEGGDPRDDLGSYIDEAGEYLSGRKPIAQTDILEDAGATGGFGPAIKGALGLQKTKDFGAIKVNEEGKVKVRNPDGEEGFIPKESIRKAKELGYEFI